MKRTSLYIKLAPEHAAKRKRAAAYKRTFGGICGGLTWRELARIAGAGRPKAIKRPGRDCADPARMVRGLEVGGAAAPVKPRESFVGMLARIGRNLTRRAAR
jgi:hypothetical protein